VNHAFADAVADAAPDGAVVLVQDYHLCLVAARLALDPSRPHLRALPPHAVRPAGVAGALPAAASHELIEGLAAHRACGFHSQRWADDLLASASATPVSRRATFVSPLASDPDDIRAAAATPACAHALQVLDERVDGRQLIGRVDRVELSKNLLRGFQALRRAARGTSGAPRPRRLRRPRLRVAQRRARLHRLPGARGARGPRHQRRFGRDGWDPILLDRGRLPAIGGPAPARPTCCS
jgi:trehalose 6-phosphate synthase